MGDMPGSLLLYDTVTLIESLIDAFIYVYILLILAYIILSWIRLPYSICSGAIKGGFPRAHFQPSLPGRIL